MGNYVDRRERKLHRAEMRQHAQASPHAILDHFEDAIVDTQVPMRGRLTRRNTKIGGRRAAALKEKDEQFGLG